jgi:hypothetical protein
MSDYPDPQNAAPSSAPVVLASPARRRRLLVSPAQARLIERCTDRLVRCASTVIATHTLLDAAWDRVERSRGDELERG